MVMTAEQAKTLIQLHLAMMDSFNVVHLRRLCRGMPKIDYDNLKGAGQRGKTRELLLAALRRHRLPQLIELCRQIEPDFAWEDRDIEVLYATDETARSVEPEELIQAIAQHFSQDDLDQLCFYLGFAPDIIAYDILLSSIVPVHMLSPGTRRKLEELGIDYQNLPQQEIKTLVKELWAESFVAYCQRRGLWERAVAVCRYLRPEAFQDGEAMNPPG